jgi:hypothetical protein
MAREIRTVGPGGAVVVEVVELVCLYDGVENVRQ